MKKFIIPFVCFSLSTAYSQITLNFSDFASIGDDVKIAVDTMPDATVLPGGVGLQNWNFNDLKVHYNSINNFVNPSTTINGSLFPFSNIAYVTSNAVAYLNAVSSKVEITGIDGDITGAGIFLPVPFQRPQRVLNFPTNFGDSFLDTTHFKRTVKATDIDPSITFIDSVRISHWGYSVNEIDAYGEMIIPGDTLQVLRKKKIEYTVDSIWILSFGIWQMPTSVPPFFDTNPIKDTIRTYEWYANNEGYTLVSMTVDKNDVPEEVSYIYKGNLAVNLTSVSPTCNGISDGSITVNFSTVGPGVAPYTYIWNTGSTSGPVLSGVSAGTYSVTVTDANLDITSASITISEPSAINIIETITNAQCNTCNGGEIELSVSGGTPGYTYSWSNLTSNNPNENLFPGSYTVTVTDINGCEAIETYNVGTWPVGVTENIIPQNTLRFYPNPAVDFISLETYADNIEIYDILGNKVFIKNITNKNIVDISMLNPGIYLLQATSGTKNYSAKLIVK